MTKLKLNTHCNANSMKDLIKLGAVRRTIKSGGRGAYSATGTSGVHPQAVFYISDDILDRCKAITDKVDNPKVNARYLPLNRADKVWIENLRLNKKVYEVRISTNGGLFFADENNESCDGSQNYWIDSKSVAESVFKKNAKSIGSWKEVELIEYYQHHVDDEDLEELEGAILDSWTS